MKPINDIHTDAINIEGLLDGVDALFDSEAKGARNAMLPIIEAAKEKLNTLINDLENFGLSRTPPTPPQPAAPKLVEQVGDAPEVAKPTRDDVFGDGFQRSHIGHLYNIHSLALIGVASLDTGANVDLSGNSSLYEQIARIAAEATDMAELAERTDKTAA